MNTKLLFCFALSTATVLACNRAPSVMVDEDGDGDEAADEDGAPDLPPACDLPSPEGSCSVWCQNCPDGQKCVLEGPSYSTTACVSLAESPLGVDEGCDLGAENDECGPGAMCFPYGGGVCVEFCGGTPEEPMCGGPGSRCHQWNEGITALCTDACDPRLASPCGDPDLACRVVDEDCDGFACGQMGAAAGTFCVLSSDSQAIAGPGEACQGVSFCQKHLACAPAALVLGCEGETEGCCTEYCTVGGTDCDGGEVCEPLYGTPPQGLETLGACLRVP